MPEGPKQGIDKKTQDELEAALIRFCERNQPANPGILEAAQAVDGRVRLVLQESDAGIALMGAALALKDHIRTSKANRMYFRTPYPSETDDKEQEC